MARSDAALSTALMKWATYSQRIVAARLPILLIIHLWHVVAHRATGIIKESVDHAAPEMSCKQVARTVPSWESMRPAQLVLKQLLEPLDQDGRETVRWEAAASDLLIETLRIHARDVGGVQSGIHGGTGPGGDRAAIVPVCALYASGRP